MHKTISQTYLAEQKKLHENPNYGQTARIYADSIKKILVDSNSKTLTDYGAGKKILKKSLNDIGYYNFEYFPYDPAFPEYGEPKPADFISCIDVMEHIEPDYLNAVLDEIQFLTKKLCFFSIATLPARKKLSDGRNAHLIQKPSRWWLLNLCNRFNIEHLQNVPGKGFVLVCKSLKL